MNKNSSVIIGQLSWLNSSLGIFTDSSILRNMDVSTQALSILFMFLCSFGQQISRAMIQMMVTTEELHWDMTDLIVNIL